MPPVTPDQGFPNGHLYRLFRFFFEWLKKKKNFSHRRANRREFVVSYPTPLCSDAYSGFIMHDPNTVCHLIVV